MKETTKENAAAATPATIQRRRRPKRRSTGVVQIDMEVHIRTPTHLHKYVLFLLFSSTTTTILSATFTLVLLLPTAFTPAPLFYLLVVLLRQSSNHHLQHFIFWFWVSLLFSNLLGVELIFSKLLVCALYVDMDKCYSPL